MRSFGFTVVWRLLAALLAALPIAFAPLDAQPTLPVGVDLPMRPQYSTGQPVSPVFEGWYRNEDGTYTLSFGYFNRNSEETIDLPLGPENYIEPVQFDGSQPTVLAAISEQGYTGRGWGVFGIVVPADWGSDRNVVWTLRSYGTTYSVPGRLGRREYQLTEVNEPKGVGSMPPALRLFGEEGEEGFGPLGVWTDRVLSVRVGEPLSLTAWGADRWDPDVRDVVPVQFRWFEHQGPSGARVEFSPPSIQAPGLGGEATVSATFSTPGQYVVRVRAATFNARDSTLHDHCCWTNGFVRVNVAP
jgi:hypothetical protein